jgi:PadR family transcriptional regulator, regulatory protein PadR
MLGEFEQVLLLAILRTAPGAYGVPIHDEIRRETGREVAIGAIYKTLGRMSEKGLVTSRMGAPTGERGGRRTRCYALTSDGRAALRQSLRSIQKLATGLDLGVDRL